MSRSLVRRAFRLTSIVAVALTALAVTAIATGRVDYVVTNGVSMEPLYHQGDLVVVARSDHYEIGDIIAYHDPAKDLVVLHRIVGGDTTGWIMRGDNNQSEDAIRPSSSQVIGRAIAHAPWIGHLLGSPAGLAALAGVVALVAFGLAGIGRRPAEDPDDDAARAPDPRRLGPLFLTLVAADVLVAVAVAAAFAFPAAPAPTPPTLTLRGALHYGAKVTASDIYPDGRIRTGDPVFTRVARAITMDVDVGTDAPTGRVTGTARLDLELSNSVGWRTRLHLVDPRPLVDGPLRLTSTVDVGHLQSIAANVAKTTGINAGTLAVSLVASGSTSTDGGEPVEYRLTFPFALSDLALTVAGPGPRPGIDGPELDTTQALTTTASLAPPQGFSAVARRILVVALLLVLTLTFLAWPSALVRAPAAAIEPEPEAEEALAPDLTPQHETRIEADLTAHLELPRTCRFHERHFADLLPSIDTFAHATASRSFLPTEVTDVDPPRVVELAEVERGFW